MHIDEIDSTLLKQALDAIGLKLKIDLEGESYCTRRTKIKIVSKKSDEIVLGIKVDGQLKDPRQLGCAIDWILRNKKCTHFLLSKPQSLTLFTIENPFPKLLYDEGIKIWLDIHC